ncbi:MAG TPA: BamA/TamA family outer membrane protein [Vicinamibacteria bacterium]|nr:BamA/TamA family outer membrane protein [Vicinamibacteria bacterium]
MSVEVLDFATEAGGLRPTRRVGGQQTHALALVGADGRSYTFRGLVKDGSHLLDSVDPDIKDSIAAKILDDLMSAQHPASELVARGLLDAAGVPCPPWRLVTLPDDVALGPFRDEFKGVVGVFAEYPQPAKAGVPGFLGATEILDHEALYQRLEAGEGDAIDARALLRARLVDILMGDWDRHRKQWRWARLPGSPLWTPIPEDRDQAFSRYDGFLLDRARARDPRFQNLGPRYARIGGLTYNGWEQDRRLLVGLSREEFVTAAKGVAARLTDASIEAAARRMPPEWYAKDGPRLVSDLRARRDALPQVAEKYYRHLAGRVDVYMTNRSERVDAVRTPEGNMGVTIRVLDAGGQPGATTYHRVFHENETEEVRLYTLGGDDVVSLVGGRRGPRLRMIGGKGDDTLDATAAGNAKLSDSEGRNRALGAPEDDKPYHAPPPPKNAPWIPPRDFTGETWGSPAVSYNGDTGAFLGYSIQADRYGFRKSPYASSQRLMGGWAFEQGGGHADYQGDFRRENSGASFSLRAYASTVEVLRFYGFGNETGSPEAEDFYRVHANQYLLYPALRFRFGRGGELSVGPALKYTSNDEAEDEFINSARPYGSGRYGALAAHAIVSWDGRDSSVFPRRGAFAALRGTYFAEAWDVDAAFGQVNGNLNGYLPLGSRLTLAVRGGGKKVFGTYPYMEAAALGQGGLDAGALAEPDNTLRGYRARRFTGDASAYGNADLRLRLSRMNLLAPGVWGVTAFADTGRVWLEGESSDTWHSSVGGGIWLSWLHDRMAASFGVSHSRESDLFYFIGGVHF